ncbi:glycosyltransferase family A protein [Rhodanobacter sp. L36]|uniref:glycosyltransferase family A protein n=1 Tax=Rhodanobacter sp. L36 TaxID=1747221 RepID=UPI00131BB181|nr:glycosyltransferase family A protein [Rhodanobacter sp. L36]
MLQSNLVARGENAPSLAMGPADVVIAIPVHNEIDRIDACVHALSQQQAFSFLATNRAARIRAVFLVNNSTDGTAEWLLQHLHEWPLAAVVIQVDLPDAERSAGRARWLVNHAAMDMAHAAHGQLFMTDADSCVPNDWVRRYSRMLEQGWDAIAGCVAINQDDCEQIVSSLDHRNHLEACYTGLIDELESLLDPVHHDPWPRHFNASGASLATTMAAVRRLDDLPSLACGEDRAFIRAMEALDLHVRHETMIPVRTSGRLFGRAKGGMADTLRHRSHVPDAWCDDRLERADRAYLRASLRATWRQLHLHRKPERVLIEQFAADLGVSLHIVGMAAELETFGASWHALEAASPRLVRRAIAPSHLALEIQRAQDLLRTVRRGVRPNWREPDIRDIDADGPDTSVPMDLGMSA